MLLPNPAVLMKAALLACTISVTSVPVALATSFRDAERQMELAYADYRAALFQTNQGDPVATQRAISDFRAKWTELVADWRTTPPPQYADDPGLGETLTTVTRLTDTAASQSDRGDLAGSHETLEGIRGALGALRARNGVIVFSDRMNAYHELMERVIGHKYETPAALAEDATVLAFLVREIGIHRPASADRDAFELAFQALHNSVDALRAAIRAGDASRIEPARKALKAPYSRMFLRFG